MPPHERDNRMRETVDARRLACPQPVVLTKKALEKADEVTVIVDNETARQNVSRLAASQGYGVTGEERDEGIYLHLTRELSKREEAPGTPVSGSTLVLITSNVLGRGDDELGDVLMRSFLHTLGEREPPPGKVVLLNSGVKLVTSGSEVLDDLRLLEGRGTEVLACGTCLGYYKLKEAVEVGQVSNMYDITSALFEAGKVISL